MSIALHIGGKYYDPKENGYYILLEIADDIVTVTWLTHHVSSRTSFHKRLMANDEYLGQATELELALL